jgi:hypothetical protein
MPSLQTRSDTKTKFRGQSASDLYFDRSESEANRRDVQREVELEERLLKEGDQESRKRLREQNELERELSAKKAARQFRFSIAALGVLGILLFVIVLLLRHC